MEYLYVTLFFLDGNQPTMNYREPSWWGFWTFNKGYILKFSDGSCTFSATKFQREVTDYFPFFFFNLLPKSYYCLTKIHKEGQINKL